MSRKRKTYSAEFKAKLVLEVLESEKTLNAIFETRAEANQAIFEYIEVFYNRQRMHGSNNNLSPVKFEEKMLREVTAA